MREFLQKIGIDAPGRYTDDREYVIDIEDSNAYSKIYSRLESSTKVHALEDDSVFDLEKNVLFYDSEKYELELQADLEKDEYKLTVTEKVED